MPKEAKADCGDEQTNADDVEIEDLGAIAAANEEGGMEGEGEEGDEGGAGGLGDAKPGCKGVGPVEFFGGVLVAELISVKCQIEGSGGGLT